MDPMDKSQPTLIMAPLQGYTDRTFRQVHSRHFSGIDLAVAPFISTMSQHRLKPSRLKDILPEFNRDLKIIPQILSNNAQDFIFLANTLYDLGHTEINWNLGCPHSKIAKKKRGSGLLPFPEEIDALLKEIIPNINNRLSVKVRLGRKDNREIFNLLPIFNRYPLSEIIVHPRTGTQMYTGMADQDTFGRILENTEHRLVYNGDIVNRNTFELTRHKFPRINHFMIGRGLIADPFLGEDIKQITSQESRILRFKDFQARLFNEYSELFSGPGHLIGRMKGFWTFFGSSFKGDSEIHTRKALKKIFKSSSLEQYTDSVDHFFDQDILWQGTPA
mgnify:FL=1